MQLPNRFNRYAFLSATAMTMGLLLYGCGESKVSQCNKIVTVANKAKALSIPKDTSGVDVLADNIDKIGTEIKTIAVQDSKLKELQTELFTMYGDISLALKAQVKATQSKDNNAVTKAKQELETATAKESDLVDRINALCK
jgi:gas vesicle protein